MSFMTGLKKIAIADMSQDALITALAPMETAIPGTSLRETATTGQRGKANARTFNVYNEGRSPNAALRHNANNARHGGGRSAV